MRYILLLSYLFAFKAIYSQQIIRFNSINDVVSINLDSILNTPSSFYEMTLVIIRAEGTSSGNETISDLNSHLTSYDKGLIRVISYELIPTKGANAFQFKYTIDGRSYAVKGNPPMFCLHINNNEIKDVFKAKMGLMEFKKSKLWLGTNKNVTNDSTFYSIVNEIISVYSSGYILSNMERPSLPQKESIILQASIGTFNQQLKRSDLIPTPGYQAKGSFSQVYSFAYQKNVSISNSIYRLNGFQLNYFVTDVGVWETNRHQTNNYILPIHPITATSKDLGLGYFTGFGHTISNANGHFYNELSVMLSKLINGISDSNINAINATDNTSISIQNRSRYSDYFGCYTRYRFGYTIPMEKSDISIGLITLWGVNEMRTLSNYNLINPTGQYSAIENATSYIFRQAIMLNLGIVIK